MKYLYECANPWWSGKTFDVGSRRESYLQDLPARLHREQVEVFAGVRGAGKTTLLRHIIQTLLDGGTPAESIFYLPLHYPRLHDVSLQEHVNNLRRKIFPGRFGRRDYKKRRRHFQRGSRYDPGHPSLEGPAGCPLLDARIAFLLVGIFGT
jgi:ATPase subunit of ABC transporter with duplicated ATPase domains